MKKNFRFQIENAALLVIDMQKYFTDPDSHAFVSNAHIIKKNILRIKEYFYKNNRPVIMTRHINSTKNAKMMAKWWNELITIKDRFSEIDRELLNKKDSVVKKSQYDAFYETSLEKILKAKKIKQVVITGVLTHLCCETTARSAFMRNFEVFFVKDSTGSYNKDFHNASILNLSHGFAIPIKTEELCKDR